MQLIKGTTFPPCRRGVWLRNGKLPRAYPPPHLRQPEAAAERLIAGKWRSASRNLCDGTTVQFVPGDARSSRLPRRNRPDNLVLHPAMVQRPRCFFHPLPPSTGGRRPVCLQHLRRHKHARNAPTDWGMGWTISPLRSCKPAVSRFRYSPCRGRGSNPAFPTPQAVLKHLKQTG